MAAMRVPHLDTLSTPGNRVTVRLVRAAAVRAPTVATLGIFFAIVVAHSSSAADTNGHWAFQPVERPPVPKIERGDWAKNPIDAFILSNLAQHQIVPSPSADPAALLRRVTLDLTGLPPSLEEIAAFEADPSAKCYEQTVDRLLASPHFGERWGRHWLDEARYADSAGYESDAKREIWKYRDWVINALNADMPYDQFLAEQLAGDLMTPMTDERLIATGFSCNALKQQNDAVETTVDRVNAFGTAYLGLTLNCARCHDHKFDPISQQEFYQLYAFFNQADDVEHDFSLPEEAAEWAALIQQIAQLKREMIQYQNGPDRDPLVWAARLSTEELNGVSQEVRQAIGMLSQDRSAAQLQLIREAHAEAQNKYQRNLAFRVDGWAAQLAKSERDALDPSSKAYLDLLPEKRGRDIPPTLLTAFWKNETGLQKRKQLIAELEERIPHGKQSLVMRQHPEARKTYSSVDQGGGQEVQPDVPAMFPPLHVHGRVPNRLDLALWSTSRENPLTARVVVNRIWQHYFGVGIVETSDNLGVQSTPPSHPELLDWLAAELMDHGWQLKHIHRLIVTSATYQQSSCTRPELQEIDPENRLLARQNRLRLEAEIIRDCALSTSGLLNRTIGGPSVFPYQPPGVMAGRADGTDWKESEPAGRYRRGMYTHFWRLTPHPFFRLFDAPDATESCTRRARTNTPLQALMLLNDPWFMEAAVALAERVLVQHQELGDKERIRWLYHTCLSRQPTAEEVEIVESSLHEQRKVFEQNPARAAALVGVNPSSSNPVQQAAWTCVARALLNLDEFVTRE